jgi:hypothetical protein
VSKIPKYKVVVERTQLYVDEIEAPGFRDAMEQALHDANHADTVDWEPILCPVKVDVMELEPVTQTSGKE